MVFRTLRALLLFASVFASYAVQWALWRATGRKAFNARFERVHHKNATRLAQGFSRLRGVFIKLGQVLSVLAPFLPKAYGAVLEQLQDDVPARPFAEVHQRLVEAYGPEAERRFAEFQPVPIAAASLAQVHRAKTKDGQEVAVKILYPKIEQLIAADLRVIRWVLPVVHRLFGFRRVETVVDQLSTMLDHETDYAHERENLLRMREIFKGREEVVIPELNAELSRGAVLVMSFERGAKLTDEKKLVELGVDQEQVAQLLVDCYLTMLLEHRVFHADPHPGNFLVQPGGRLVILDYGAVEDLNEPLVNGLKKVFMGGMARNADMVFAGVEAMGFVAEDGDRALLKRVSKEYLQVLSEAKITNFAQIDHADAEKLSGFSQIRGRMRSIAGSLNYPEGYFYVERTIALLFGLIGQLAPNKGLLGIGAPLASKAMLRGFRARRAPAATEAS